MTDVHSKETRSFNMSRIRGKDTKPEIIVRKFLHARGFRYRLHVKTMPGKPDIVLPKYKTAIFVHGCFWHGHDQCRYYVIPKTRRDWWLNKIHSNIANDSKATGKLKDEGWNILVLWECDLKKDKLHTTLNELAENLAAGIK
jgi:DNA mismatch endonuclease, patch repair protein